jgi:hypothetical protein
MFVSGEAWRLFKRAHPEQDFSNFWLEASLKFSIGCFDLSSFFLLRKNVRSALSTPPSAKVPKMEPLSPLPMHLTSPMPATRLKKMFVNRDMLLSFRFEFCAKFCNYRRTVQKFLCE